MRILVDENIPLANEALSKLGDVRLLPAEGITPESVRDAEILFVRSVTKVNEQLLNKSKVRFVGTATIGTDHIDKAYLRRRGITFASAPGSNANSVAEYVATALLLLARRRGWDLSEMTIGIVGVGNVGSRVALKTRALGMRVLLNDPPLKRTTGDPEFLPIEALFEADFVTLHVPLSSSGPDATFHMVDEQFIRAIPRGVVLINTSRGPVVEQSALLGALRSRHLEAAVLDVWEGEPNLKTALLKSVEVATPHIAGYSLDGKVNGTAMLHRALCSFLGIPAQWNSEQAMPPCPLPEIQPAEDSPNDQEVLARAALKCYPIERDDGALRELLSLPAAVRAEKFRQLRRDYPERREFFNTRAVVPESRPGLKRRLGALGFRTSTPR